MWRLPLLALYAGCDSPIRLSARPGMLRLDRGGRWLLLRRYHAVCHERPAGTFTQRGDSVLISFREDRSGICAQVWEPPTPYAAELPLPIPKSSWIVRARWIDERGVWMD